MGVPATDLRSLGVDAVYDKNRVRPVTSGLASARPTVALIRADSFYYETDTGRLWYSNGTTWTLVSSAAAQVTAGTTLPVSPANGDSFILTDSATSPTYWWRLRWFSAPAKWYPEPSSWGHGTTLPSVPAGVDKVTFDLTDSTSAPTYWWSFRYNTGSASAYKWEFTGGASLQSYANANYVINTGTQIGATGYYYAAGMAFTLPRAGDYVVRGWANFFSNGGATGTCGMAVFSDSTLGATRAYAQLDVATGTDAAAAIEEGLGAGVLSTVGIALGSTIPATHKGSYFGLFVTPVRVS